MERRYDYMERIRYNNIGYTALIFELMSLFIWIYLIFCIYQHNLKPSLMLITGAILLFFCTFSLLGERNEMPSSYSYF